MSESEMQSSSNRALLSIQDLHVWYELKRFGFGHAGFVKAVDGVSFDLKQGDSMACVGESGCGKSSLMKTIIGINRPTKGDIVFGYKPLGRAEPYPFGDVWLPRAQSEAQDGPSSEDPLWR